MIKYKYRLISSESWCSNNLSVSLKEIDDFFAEFKEAEIYC